MLEIDGEMTDLEFEELKRIVLKEKMITERMKLFINKQYIQSIYRNSHKRFIIMIISILLIITTNPILVIHDSLEELMIQVLKLIQFLYSQSQGPMSSSINELSIKFIKKAIKTEMSLV